ALALRLGAICVSAHHAQLALPDGRPVHLLLAGHPDRDDGSALAREPHRVVEAGGPTDALEGDIRTAEEQRPVDPVEAPCARREPDALMDVSRVDHLVGTHLLSKLALGRMLGYRNQPPRRREQPDRGHY